MIAQGASLPSNAKIQVAESGNFVTAEELFQGKRTVLFAVPGAFTPTCSEKHLPGFISLASQIKGLGIDMIACVSVNDAFVMKAWGQSHSVGDAVTMLADGNAEFATEIGMAVDIRVAGFGTRSQRYAMILDGLKVEWIAVDTKGQFADSSAERVLSVLQEKKGSS
eukprot:NODE_5508_length_670_cov_51.114332_g5132_i0.p1 GENE.NODE_5508_length_670_cov_51.114332_g5132_i0~~NODE_5508_length_670_cov_51.114332_g5132_i0.p1  ORF type:complete len:190 (-),score=48.48 NODE_5508_length_670_cov_51.114332_g5132_i0:101-598(-)